ncbi:MAG: AbrB/MazE/SpoVT family DNA-binding domain-containing protein [Microcystis sp.]|jgi:AbrB family looped-hinge helix DNA binding protein|uniref:AbrB/MazE/SpoVT family DNA-binding domain-containing protein n=1 Tax=Microcystis TaxID=1125 RepID=UPI002246ED70|nr:AbrB/MazE/SpoVT family DNA-binding domain-containing protein [Microcystis aeruginosa]NCQ93632.1 AbrB/MazE/SpoVT family DNA-binding domain-containing protein [Microcystis aeruginosa LG13-13]NCR06748.1 AbrB/MazE/SpoVT family DNA-binding domain-containing protein [Microcystis aeruginosa LG13-03]NCR64940.1 AbrB/MazE/SpoVT family DNA-binding domain-containing protein [Microcystis aeruginosa LG11-05]NCR73892.1 AbrB/MazE/SpoVT family DNA-binding domain-containing protein [Microcystis aeruginosa LG1
MTLPESATSKIGKKGVVVIPAKLRRRYGLEEGSLVIAEETPEGILIRPAVAMPVEIYSPERRAEFLLSNATDEEEYQAARTDVVAMGLNPDEIQHHRL